MNWVGVIRRTVLSEKAHKLMENGIYTFLVDKRAKKEEIAKVLKRQFSVDAVRVNISQFAPKQKRISGMRKSALVGGGKKAIVWLKAGQTITMFSLKRKNKSAKKEKAKEEKGV